MAGRAEASMVVAAAAALAAAVGPPGSPGRAQPAGRLTVTRPGIPVLRAPLPGAPRRGTLAGGAVLAPRERRTGRGCARPWFRVGPDAWICGEDLRSTDERPPPSPETGDALPFRYALVASDALPAYARASDVRRGRFAETLGVGFGVVVVGERWVDGIPFVVTRRGLLIEREGLRFPAPSAFAGVTVDPGAPLPAWTRRAARLERDDGTRTVVGPRTVLRVRALGPRWARVVDGDGAAGRVRRRDLAVALPPPAERLEPAPGVGEGWVSVDVATQVVMAFRGTEPVWATLASTGRRAHPTPLGTHRVWAKLATSDMSDLERDDVRQHYALEAVPWVLYFAEGVGFHAAFWHDGFGRPRSHGCVNLAPADAHWLFRHLGPTLPSGWSAVLPTDADPGARVVVWRSTDRSEGPRR